LWFWRALPWPLHVLLWGQWLAVLIGLRCAGLFKLMGPVFFSDLVRMTRRGRYFLVRCLYAGALLFMLWVIWSSRVAWYGGSISANEMAAFAGTFFYWFMAVQFGMVIVLTPAYTAGAIAEEKDRRTLEFILATDLRDREIVMGKLASRLVNLAFVVLAGLPVLSCLQFLGGIDPGLVLAGFAATALTMFSLAALSILCSVLVRKPRDAIILPYLFVPAYWTVSGLSLLLIVSPEWAAFPSTADWTSPVTLRDVVEWLNAGNTVYALTKLAEAAGTTPLDQVLPGMLGRYAVFHGLFGLVCCTWAVLRLRSVALRESSRPARRRARRRLWDAPIGQWPMVWKEVVAEPGFRLHWLGRVFVGALVVAGFVPLWLILGDPFLSQQSEARLAINAWVRGVGTGVACLMLLGVAVRAASSISGERDRQTLDSLLTSPLESADILYSKWVGSILGVRWAWIWLGVIWLIGVFTGGLNFLAVPLTLGAWLVLAAFVAALGLWFSTVSKTTLRATVWTLVTLVGLWGGHWLIWVCCAPCLIAAGPGAGVGSGDAWRLVFEFHGFGLTPPATLALLAFQGQELTAGPDSANRVVGEIACCSLVGLAVWGAGAAMLWSATTTRFSHLYGRMPRARPRTPGRAAELFAAADEPSEV
jgi:ABC-type transport system involved in multi-copper enzyme maturation permease subunit